MYYRNSDVRLEEMPRPEPGPGEVLVKVRASGICGSDVMEWYRIRRAPLVLGHEIAGDIAELGEGVDGWCVGDRVVVTHHVPCNTCKYCLAGHHSVCDTLRRTNFYPGGFSEFVRVPTINVDRGMFRLPGDMTYDQGSFAEPLGCVVRGMRLAGLRPGETVLVLGSGIAGALNIKLARALGSGSVIATDISEARRGMAERFGADHALDAGSDIPRKVKEITGSEGVDLAVVCTGALPAFDQAIRSVDRGGAVMFFAPPLPGELVGLPVNELWRNEVRLMTSYAAAPSDIVRALQLISSGRVVVDDMITHRLPLAETQAGFLLTEGGGDSLKVIVQPDR